MVQFLHFFDVRIQYLMFLRIGFGFHEFSQQECRLQGALQIVLHLFGQAPGFVFGQACVHEEPQADLPRKFFIHLLKSVTPRVDGKRHVVQLFFDLCHLLFDCGVAAEHFFFFGFHRSLHLGKRFLQCTEFFRHFGSCAVLFIIGDGLLQ